ncbi:hypothetical protein PTTG_28843 [Puccinia triticina 1-1 BBBD Race 1]|uniref:Uncharacterized protein n=1 Tax=Puccinia triticina (isolate 1-1 / race 1 (BBBD)) TaxID=630390 RepID=A0A180G937_PUCT1|nr:hypothetical protein PTTG_28843 [Puccinia triticina 1-1 BBBD Race 1]
MSKYVSLPDIDTAPDVYETPDLPTIHITERDDDSDSEVLPPGGHAQPAKTHSPNTDIIKDTLDQSSARKKFGAASGLDGRDADFSTSLLRKPPRRASARGYPPPASRSQTFETDEYDHPAPGEYAVDGRPGERDGAGAPIHYTKLYEHQLSLLTQPRHLDSISRRVKVIVTDLERVHEARRKLTDSRPLSIALASGITVVTHNQQQPGSSALANVPGVIAPAPDRAPPLPPDALHKLDRLYSLLPRLDPLLPLVPHLLSRLRSLAHLHASADSFRTRLDDALNRLRASADRTTHLSQLLTSIQNNADANHALVAQNLALVDQRIDRLLLAVDRLKPS